MDRAAYREGQLSRFFNFFYLKYSNESYLQSRALYHSANQIMFQIKSWVVIVNEQQREEKSSPIKNELLKTKSDLTQLLHNSHNSSWKKHVYVGLACVYSH